MRVSIYEKIAIDILTLLKYNPRDFTVDEILQALYIKSNKFYGAMKYLLPRNYIIKNNSKRPAIYKYNFERDKL